MTARTHTHPQEKPLVDETLPAQPLDETTTPSLERLPDESEALLREALDALDSARERIIDSDQRRTETERRCVLLEETDARSRAELQLRQITIERLQARLCEEARLFEAMHSDLSAACRVTADQTEMLSSTLAEQTEHIHDLEASAAESTRKSEEKTNQIQGLKAQSAQQTAASQAMFQAHKAELERLRERVQKAESAHDAMRTQDVQRRHRVTQLEQENAQLLKSQSTQASRIEVLQETSERLERSLSSASPPASPEAPSAAPFWPLSAQQSGGGRQRMLSVELDPLAERAALDQRLQLAWQEVALREDRIQRLEQQLVQLQPPKPSDDA